MLPPMAQEGEPLKGMLMLDYKLLALGMEQVVEAAQQIMVMHWRIMSRAVVVAHPHQERQ